MLLEEVRNFDRPRYFFVRVHSEKQLANDPLTFLDAVRVRYPDAYSCALHVRDVLELRPGQRVAS